MPEWRDDCGWGPPGSEYEGVHFKTFIAASVRIVEAFALARDPALKACPDRPVVKDDDPCDRSALACDVEEYLQRIREALGEELGKDLCRQYLAFYRNARTPGRECSEREYRSFLDVFQEILRRLQR